MGGVERCCQGAYPGAAVSFLLAATTEIPEMLKGLARLRVPAIFLSITSFMVRYMALIADDLRRMRDRHDGAGLPSPLAVAGGAHRIGSRGGVHPVI